jgi:hypothetical protein
MVKMLVKQPVSHVGLEKPDMSMLLRSAAGRLDGLIDVDYCDTTPDMAT